MSSMIHMHFAAISDEAIARAFVGSAGREEKHSRQQEYPCKYQSCFFVFWCDERVHNLFFYCQKLGITRAVQQKNINLIVDSGRYKHPHPYKCLPILAYLHAA